ncbi:MAG: T9SS type A sorting domain-containing protein [Candidatus Methylacidiphilales bacterium]
MKKILNNYLITTCLLLSNLDSFAGSGCGSYIVIKRVEYYTDTVYINQGDSVNFKIYCYGVQEGPFYLNWFKNGILINPNPIFSKNVSLFVTEAGHYSFVSTSHGTLNCYLINRYPIATNEIVNNANLFNFFPNPSNDKITIKLKEHNDDLKMSLIDQHGKEIQLSFLRKSNLEVVIDIKEFPKGIYFLKYEDKTKVIVKKLVIY